MSSVQPGTSSTPAASLVQRLISIFGQNTTIAADYKEDGTIHFSDPVKTKNHWQTKLPVDIELFGPGIYQINIKEDSFYFALACDQ